MGCLKLDDDTSVYLGLARNVVNLSDIRKDVLNGELACCLIKPSLIVDPLQILAAAYKAHQANKNNEMITKTVYSEILFNLSTSKNISESLSKFGVSDKGTDLLYVVLADETTAKSLQSRIKGDILDLKELSALSDLKEISKVYNIKDTESKVSSVTESVVSRIALKQQIISSH